MCSAHLRPPPNQRASLHCEQHEDNFSCTAGQSDGGTNVLQPILLLLGQPVRVPPNCGPGICHWSVPVAASRAEVLPKPFIYEGHNRVGKDCRARVPLQLVGAIQLLCKVSVSSRVVVPEQASNIAPSTSVNQLRWSPKSASSARNGAALLKELVVAGWCAWLSGSQQQPRTSLGSWRPSSSLSWHLSAQAWTLLDWSCSLVLSHIQASTTRKEGSWSSAAMLKGA